MLPKAMRAGLGKVFLFAFSQGGEKWNEERLVLLPGIEPGLTV